MADDVRWLTAELQARGVSLHVQDLVDALTAQRLHLVHDAGKAVLDAMAKRPCHIVDAEAWAVLEAIDACETNGSVVDVVRAEVERRARRKANR